MDGTIRYTIRPYDTIWMLAQVFNTTVDSIMELNPGVNPRNLQIGQVITIRPGFQYYQPYPVNTDGDTDMGLGREELMGELCKYFRMLWAQHVYWTRMAVMGIVHDLPETDFIIQRLLRNPADFADALRAYYGYETAQGFADLFSEHISLAAELVRNAKAGNMEAAARTEQRWFENAAAIADFLARINPNWSREDWSAMLNEHLELLRDNSVDMLEGNYEASVNGFDDIDAQAMEMADMMCEGVAMQFA